MLTTIIIFIALLSSILMFGTIQDEIINKPTNSDSWKFIISSCLLWAYFYYLTTH